MLTLSISSSVAAVVASPPSLSALLCSLPFSVSVVSAARSPCPSALLAAVLLSSSVVGASPRELPPSLAIPRPAPTLKESESRRAVTM
jgi:hypothetical protein